MYNFNRFGFKQPTPRGIAKAAFKPKVNDLFDRAATVRGLMDAPRSYRYVLGQAGVGLGSLNGLGVLPNLVSENVGGGAAQQFLDSQVIFDIAPDIRAAKAAEAKVAEVLNVEGAEGLRSDIKDAEEAIATAWSVLLTAIRNIARHAQELVDAGAVPEPNWGQPKYVAMGEQGFRPPQIWEVIFADRGARLTVINAANGRYAGAMTIAAQKRTELQQVLRAYANNIPIVADELLKKAAADRKGRTIAINVKNAQGNLDTATANAATAKNVVEKSQLDNQAEIFRQQLEALKRQGEVAALEAAAALKRASKAAAATVADKKSNLPLILGGGVVVAGLVWWLSRRRG